MMRAARAAWAGCVMRCSDGPDRRMFICNPSNVPGEPRHLNHVGRSGDVLELSQMCDIALEQCAEKLARLRVGQLAVGIELLVSVRHQHFGTEKNVGVGGREHLTKLNLAAHGAGQAGRGAYEGGDLPVEGAIAVWAR